MKRGSGWIVAIILNGIVFPAFGQGTNYQILLPPAEFDPLESVPTLPTSLQADSTGELFIVQFTSQPVEEDGWTGGPSIGRSQWVELR